MAKVSSPSRIVFHLVSDSLSLPSEDSASGASLWIAAVYERSGRWKDAEALYRNVFEHGSWPARAYAKKRLVLISPKASPYDQVFVPVPLRAGLRWLMVQDWGPTMLVVALAVLLWGMNVFRRKKGDGQVRVHKFIRNLPLGIGISIEDLIIDCHRRTTNLSVGIVVNSGNKLPIVLQDEPNRAQRFIDVFVPEGKLAKMFSFFAGDQPRFHVNGHVEGSLRSLRLVAVLTDKGRLVHTWERTGPYTSIGQAEEEIACDIIKRLSEVQ